MDPQLLRYYEAIERASAEMLAAARAGLWDEVVRLEGACVLLISQLKNEALRQEERDAGQDGEPARARREAQAAARWRVQRSPLEEEAARLKSRIMQRILVNDAEIRQLAEPWLQDLDDSLAGRRQVMH